jgi:chromosome segregation ATPase
MTFLDLFSFIKSLLESEVEVIASFLTGVVCTIMGLFAFRHLVLPRRSCDKELARKDLEIARQDAEIARGEAQVVSHESKMAAIEEKLARREGLIESMVEERKRLQEAAAAQNEAFDRLRAERSNLDASYADTASLTTECAALKERYAMLEAENNQLVLTQRSLEKSIQRLQSELALVEAELTHSAKWLQVFDEENARLSSQKPI